MGWLLACCEPLARGGAGPGRRPAAGRWLSVAAGSCDASPATVKVVLKTSLGDIVLAVETERAPITAANFLRYVDQKRLDGSDFLPRDGRG